MDDNIPSRIEKNDGNKNERRNLLLLVIAAVVIVVIVAFIVFGGDKDDDNSNNGAGTEIDSGQSVDTGDGDATDFPDGDIDDEATSPDIGESDSDSGSNSGKISVGTTDNPPLPGENKPILKDPKGKTVWDRFSPNRTDLGGGVQGVGGWGNAYWPIQKKKELITPVEDVPVKTKKVTLKDANENKEVTSSAINGLKDVFNVNTRNYASMSCGIAAAMDGLPSVKRGFASDCKRDRQPTLEWEQLQKQGVIFYLSNLEEMQQGSAFGYDDSRQPYSRVYIATVASADQNGQKKTGMKPQKYIVNASLEKYNGKYGISDIVITDYME